MSIRNSNIKIHFLVVVNVNGMRPCANYGHKYCSSPRCYMSVIPDGMIMTEENWRSRRQTYPSATLSTTNPTWFDPGVNPGLRVQRRRLNRLSHVTVFLVLLVGSSLLKMLRRKEKLWSVETKKI